MGLDISIGVDNEAEIFTPEYDEDPALEYAHCLSRTFCNFMCRKDAAETEPELDQIGRITGVDISPLYEMEQYPHEEDMDLMLEFAPESDADKERMKADAAEQRAKLGGNLDRVLQTVDALIARLSEIDYLPQQLIDDPYDTLGRKEYFSGFRQDTGDGYIGNNFGQDLRNFKRFLEYAKERGSKTVYFRYG